MNTIPRLTQPRKWRSLVLASASVTLAVAGAPTFASLIPAPVTLARAPDARLWLAQAQGGEGGESGIVATATDPAAAYLAELTMLEGHMVAARDLYAEGNARDAIDLTGHPAAEGMLATIQTALAARGQPDIAPALAAFSATMQNAASQPDVDAALSSLSAAIASAQATEAHHTRYRFDAVVLVLKAASEEYTSSITADKVTDTMAYHEARSYIALSRSALAALAADPLAAKAVPRALDALKAADDAFGDMANPQARDPAILAAVAARVELIASSVR